MTTPKVQYAYSEMSGGANHSRPISMTYPNGRVIHVGYNTTSSTPASLDDSISRLSFWADDDGMGGIGTHLEDESYLGLSTVIKRSHPLAAGTLDLTYIGTPGDGGDQYAGLDRFGRVIDQHWINTNTSTVTDEFTYSFDRDGNRLSRNNTVNTAFNEQYTDMSGAYDPLNRMTAFSRGSHSQRWGLDALGNWTTLTTDGTQTQTRTFNLQNQITSISGATMPVYDANGNTTTDEKGNGYVYDAWNRLVRVNVPPPTTGLLYDALNRRIQDDAGTQLYYSNQWQVVEEQVGGAMTAQYVWSPVYVDALVERDTAGGPRLYVQQDANWNVTAIVNSMGAVQERYVYDPYGQPTFLTPNWTVLGGSAFSWVYLHQGGRFDTVSGLYYFRNRDYSPTLGRWLQQDPIGFKGGDTNFYAYVHSRPIGLTDPEGLGAAAGVLVIPPGAIAELGAALAAWAAANPATAAIAATLAYAAGCMYASGALQTIYDVVRGGFSGDDKMAHCTVSCKLAKCFGSLGAAFVGDIIKEVIIDWMIRQGILGSGKFDALDIGANHVGIGCAGGWLNGIPGLSVLWGGVAGLVNGNCYDCCHEQICVKKVLGDR
jgi:RHS repeat-associated protein